MPPCDAKAMSAVLETHLALPNRRQGKVRDLYDLPAGIDALSTAGASLLMVATDRISAFDVVMPTAVPGKGALLTELASRWFAFIAERGLARSHLLSTDTDLLTCLSAADRRLIAGRSMICRRCRVVPIECVVRGYLDGSGWVDYQRTGAVCAVKLPPGLQRGDRLPEPIFTPATKEAVGVHDENISYERACERVGRDVVDRVRRASLAIYDAAHAFALERGLILADTKFEFGFELDAGGNPTDQLLLIDEVLTPDSSRYWDAAGWKPGHEQPSFDKQFLREYLNGLVARGEWDKQAPGPQLPPGVVEGTRCRYEEARRRLFG